MSEKKKKSDWEKVAEIYIPGSDEPGNEHDASYEFTLDRRGIRWHVEVFECGSGVDDRGKKTKGRGDTATEAIDAIRKDVIAWAGDNAMLRAELATTMRSLEYAAEDAEYEAEDMKG